MRMELESENLEPYQVSSITGAAAKFIYKALRDAKDPNLTALDVVKEHNLWLVDEWTHIGFIILTCLDNSKLIASYNKGNVKVLDALIGKTIKMGNMTVDAEYVKEMLPIIIEVYFSAQ